MKTLALAFVSFLAGYGFGVFGERREREREDAADLAAAEEDMALYWNSPSTDFVPLEQVKLRTRPEPYGGQNLTSVSGVPVTVSWGRDE